MVRTANICSHAPRVHNSTRACSDGTECWQSLSACPNSPCTALRQDQAHSNLAINAVTLVFKLTSGSRSRQLHLGRRGFLKLMFCDGIKRVAIDCDLPAASCSCITACYPQATEDKSKTRPVVLQDALQKFEACQTGCADAAAVSSKLRSGSKQVYSKHQSCWYQQVERSVDELCPQPCSGHSWQEGVAIKAAGDAARWDLAVALLGATGMHCTQSGFQVEHLGGIC